MKIACLYNEILPKKSAHDVYLYRFCHSLSFVPKTQVSLLIGKGSEEKVPLDQHFGVSEGKFDIIPRWIIRKNKFFGLKLPVSWNKPFFSSCQKWIEEHQPDVVWLSVIKQANYHLKRKVKGVLYVYEAHGLSYYPNTPLKNSKNLQLEIQALRKADLVVVTTQELKAILEKEPYCLSCPIEVAPFASSEKALPPISYEAPLKLFYAGQLYRTQGLELLIESMKGMQGVYLQIAGGKKEEQERLKALAKSHGVQHMIDFLGFLTPSVLREKVLTSHVLVAPFLNEGCMPFVAHTKIHDYAAWGRWIIAPNMNVVKEVLGQHAGVFYFTASSASSLREAIEKAKEKAEKEPIIQGKTSSLTTEERAVYISKILNQHIKKKS